jgi:hypothetical protein
MFGWYKAWRDKRKLLALAKQIIANPTPSLDALIKARGIIEALAARKEICRTCFEPFVPKPRDFGQRFTMRSILMIPDAEPDPMICDSCFSTSITTFNRQAGLPGTSNAGAANLALQKLLN